MRNFDKFADFVTDNIIYPIIVSIVCIVVMFVLTFVLSTEVTWITYLCAISLVITGIWLIMFLIADIGERIIEIYYKNIHKEKCEYED